MLKETAASEIRGVTLANGASLIATVTPVDGGYKVEQPLMIQQIRTQTGIDAQFVPAVPCKDPLTYEAIIDSTHVMFVYELPADIESAYRASVSRIEIVGGTGVIAGS